MFEHLVKKQIDLFRLPSLDCVDAVHEELRRTMEKCEFEKIKKDLIRFPNLSRQINDVVVKLLAERVQPTKDFVKSLIQIQLNYINTRHPDFLKEKLQLDLSDGGDNEKDNSEHDSEDENGKLSSLDKKNCKIIQHLLKCYLNIVRKTIEDMVLYFGF